MMLAPVVRVQHAVPVPVEINLHIQIAVLIVALLHLIDVLYLHGLTFCV